MPILLNMTHVFYFLRRIFLSPIVLGEIRFPFNLSYFLLQFTIPVLIFFVSVKLILLFLTEILSAVNLNEDVKEKIYHWARVILRIIFSIFILVFTGRLFGAEILRYIRIFYDLLSTPFFESGSTRITLITIIMMIPVFYMASWIARGTVTFINRSVLNNFSIDEAKKFTISSMIKYGIMVVVIIIGLSIIGINLSSLTVIFGVLGIGLGFGLQGVVANFFAGIIIIFTRPITEGDQVLIQQSEGTVVKVRLLSSTINTLMNESIIVPNSQLVNDKIYNYSYEDKRVIIVNKVQISYGDDLEKVIDVMEGLALKNPYALKIPEPKVRVASFDDSGISVKLFTWVRNVSDKYDGLSWTNIQIWREFKKNKITIPFPQMDVRIKKG